MSYFVIRERDGFHSSACITNISPRASEYLAGPFEDRFDALEWAEGWEARRKYAIWWRIYLFTTGFIITLFLLFHFST